MFINGSGFGAKQLYMKNKNVMEGGWIVNSLRQCGMRAFPYASSYSVKAGGRMT